MFWVAILPLLFDSLYGYKRGDKIYDNLQGISGCFRILNGTHQIGCSSSLGGDFGVLHYIKDLETIDWLLSNGTHHPYIVLLNSELFDLQNLITIKKSGKVAGVLVIATSDGIDYNKFLSGFSPDQTCPNLESDLYKNDSIYGNCNLRWNLVGKGLYFHDFSNFPIFLVRNNETVHKLINQCYLRFNIDGPSEPNSAKSPLCAVQLTFEMYGVKDTATCRRRSLMDSLSNTDYCDIMGDRNVWSFHMPSNNSVPLSNRSVIVLSARMDALTMFEGISPAVESAITGMITLLSVANTLSKLRGKMAINPANKNVMFLFLNGESYDYIGSSSLIYDMNVLGQFPEPLDKDLFGQLAMMNTSHISHYVEIGEVGLPDNFTFWLHSDPISRRHYAPVQSEVQRLIDQFKEQNTLSPLIKFAGVDKEQPLPPASLQSFLKADSAIPGIFIGDHSKEYHNKFFHSHLDDMHYLDHHYGRQKSSNASLAHVIQALATSISRVVYTLATNTSKDAEKIEADYDTINQLLECYTKNPSCSFWKALSDQVVIDIRYEFVHILAPDQTPFPHYVSVKSFTEPYTALTQLSLAYLTRTEHMAAAAAAINAKTKEECHGLNKNQSIYDYYWARGFETEHKNATPFCYASITHWSPAVSPAFRIDNYDLTSNKGSYSTWTESVWSSQPKLRMFLLPDTSHDITMLAIGLFMTILTLAVILFGKHYYTTLFNLNNAENELPNGLTEPSFFAVKATTSTQPS